MKNLSVENLINAIKSFFNKDRKLVFLVTIIAGLFFHFQQYSDGLLALDGYWHYGSFITKGWEISLGRFLLPISDLLRGTVVSTSLTTFISLIILGFTSVLLVDVLEIKKKYIKVLVSLFLVATPTFSLTLMYAYTTNGYVLAMFFAVLSVYFLGKKKSLKNILLSLICIIATIGFYQAYLCVITTLLLIKYILKVVDKNKLSVRKLAKGALADFAILLLGLVAYYVCLQIIVKVLHLDISSYSGENSIVSIETFKNIIPAIKNTYITFYEFYFTDNILNNLAYFRNILSGLTMALIIVNFVAITISNKNYKSFSKMLLLVLMILVYPVFACSIELIAQSRSINLLMASSLYFVMILLLKQIELMDASKCKNILELLSALIFVLITWTFVLSNSATYVATKLFNNQMDSIGSIMVEKLKTNDEITDDTPIVVLGKLNFKIYNDRLLKLTNFDVSDINSWTWQVYLEDNLGIGRKLWTYQDYNYILETDEFKDMAYFPDENSIRVINGIAVVKLSD